MDFKTAAKKIDRLFNGAANAWTRGNNSGNSDILQKEEARAEKLQQKAEEILKPLGITCYYPGLYPAFRVHGANGEYYSTDSALKAAWEARVFYGGTATGLVWADRFMEQDGDYLPLARLDYATLTLTVYKECNEIMADFIRQHAKATQDKKGQTVQWSATQTITLGFDLPK